MEKLLICGVVKDGRRVKECGCVIWFRNFGYSVTGGTPCFFFFFFFLKTGTPCFSFNILSPIKYHFCENK